MLVRLSCENGMEPEMDIIPFPSVRFLHGLILFESKLPGQPIRL